MRCGDSQISRRGRNLESDLWVQYNELGGVKDNEVPGITGGSAAYIDARKQLDGDMPQFIHDNTEDEITPFQFINAYLMSKGQAPANLEQFRTLPSSKATGAANRQAHQPDAARRGHQLVGALPQPCQ